MTGSLHRTLFILGQENPDVGINTQISIVENAVTDAFTKDLTSLTSPYALTTTNPGAEAYNFYLYTFTGTLTGDFTIECPVDKRPYKVVNSTTGGYNIIFKTVAGTGITIPPSAGAAVYCDGTNVIQEVGAAATGSAGGDLTGSYPNPTIASSAVTNAKMANMADQTFKGNVSGGSAAPSDLTATQVTAALNEMVGDSGSGVTKGLVPAASTGSASTKFLRKDGTWAVPGGSGTVVTVEDGSTTVSNPTAIDFTSGAVVTDLGGGVAGVDISSGGSYKLLEHYAASSSATLDFTSSISSTYDDYIFEGVDIISATNAVSLLMQVGTGGGPTYDTGGNYNWTRNYNIPGGAYNFTGSTGTLGDTAFTLMILVSNTTPLWFQVKMKSPASAFKKLFDFEGMQIASDSNNYHNKPASGVYVPTTALTAIRFLMSSGNIASGTIRCYGRAKT